MTATGVRMLQMNTHRAAATLNTNANSGIFTGGSG
jgi:hypothetical protein